MTRLIYSTAALMILTIGVMSFDTWENMLNRNDFKEIWKTSLFPPRQTRTQSCNCTSKADSLDLGPYHHPRFLVTNECEYETCTQSLTRCQNVKYTIDISVFKHIDSCVDRNLLGPQQTCYNLLRITPKTITVACIPVPSTTITSSNGISY